MEYVIQKKDTRKGRSFKAWNVATVQADSLFPEGETGKCIRPIWAMFAGSESELKAFVANLLLGRKAEPANRWGRQGDSNRLEFLRSLGYQVFWQREEEGSLVTIYHPELFRLDPGMIDPEGIRFVMLVPGEWSRQQELDTERVVAHALSIPDLQVSEELARSLVAPAYLFGAYLDRRTQCPLIADGRFYLQLLCFGLQLGFVSFAGDSLGYHPRDWGYNPRFRFQSHGLTEAGVVTALAMSVSHETFQGFLAEQIAVYFGVVGGAS